MWKDEEERWITTITLSICRRGMMGSGMKIHSIMHEPAC